MRTRIKQTVLLLGLASAFGVAQAATATGNLSVATTVSASCNTPSPSGNLVLPFDGTAYLHANYQPLASEITLAIVCTGAPTLTSIAFGVGANGPTNAARLMKNSSGSYNLLGYKLYASTATGAGTDESTLRALTAGSPSTAAASSTLSLTGLGSSPTVYVNGRISHENLNNSQQYTNPSSVSAGSYNDTVNLRLTYN